MRSLQPVLSRPDHPEGKLSNQDWLPSGNVTWGLTPPTCRLAASRALSRPDLNEFRASPRSSMSGALPMQGNPALPSGADRSKLRRAARSVPGLSEVLAVGYFYKHFHEPIEQVFQGGAPPDPDPAKLRSRINRGVEVPRPRRSRPGGSQAARALDQHANASVINVLPWRPSRSSLEPHGACTRSRARPATSRMARR